MALCCPFEDMVGTPLPFNRAIALEYGEGRAVSGLCYCGTHTACYRYVQLASHPWDDVVVYGLYPISSDYFTSLQLAYNKVCKVKWPMWILPTIDSVPESKREALITMEDTIWSHGRLEVIIAARDIVKSKVYAARKSNGHTHNWFDILGL